MADAADPAAPPGEISVEPLIEFFESAVVKLTDAGVPAENLVEALRVALARAENLLAPPDKPHCCPRTSPRGDRREPRR